MSKTNVSPPPKPLLFSGDDVGKYLKSDLFNYLQQLYQCLYFVWERTGSYLSNIPTTKYNLNTKGNIGSSATDLLSYTLQSNSLDSDGQVITIQGFGTFASNANNKSLKLSFGSSVILQTPSLAINGAAWNVIAQVYRASSGAQKIIVNASSGTSLLVAQSFYRATKEDLTKDLQIVFNATGVTDNDIVQEGLIVQII
jgi:hypothetical protein